MWMYQFEMASECVVPTESFLLFAKVTPHLDFARIMDGVLVTRKIIWSGEYCITFFPSGGIVAITFVRTGLRVALQC